MSDDYQEVTGNGPTLLILERIHKNHTLIHLRIQGRPTIWNTTIIAVDLNRQRWLFDELSTLEGHQLLMKERNFAIETRLDGVLVKFKSEVHQSGIDARGLTYYQALPPNVIQIYQRRDNFRVPLPATQRATIKFVLPETGPMRAIVRDISLGGIGFNFSNWVPSIERGLEISNCTITLPDGKILSCDLRICFVRRGVFGTIVGASFINLARDTQKQISRWVMSLDRERAKLSNRFNKE